MSRLLNLLESLSEQTERVWRQINWQILKPKLFAQWISRAHSVAVIFTKRPLFESIRRGLSESIKQTEHEKRDKISNPEQF